MKLSEIKGDRAFDALADIIEPVSTIMTDQEVLDTYRGAPKMELVKLLLKKHRKAITEIMAILDGVPVEEYEVSVVSLPVKLLEILNDPELAKVFQSPEQTKTSFGSVTGNTEEKEK